MAARNLAERQRHWPLTELADWTLKTDERERHLARTQGGTVTNRVGFGRDNVLEASPAEAAERRFLEPVAERIIGALAPASSSA